jgi:acyl-coenzyme A thioesterase PaaI-like protein
LNKQPTSRMCFVCGERNPAGVHVRFYEQADGSVLARFSGSDEHQGYPARMHGGVITAILDETMARAIMVSAGAMACGVTVQITVRFSKPVPLQIDLTAVARMAKDWPRMFEASAQLLLPDGGVAAEASGRYVKVDLNAMPEFDAEQEQWSVRAD